MVLINVFSEVSEEIDAFLKMKIDDFLNKDIALNLKEAVCYSLFSSGKRIRPFLVYSLAEILHIEKNKVHSIAAAIECVHTYSLIHDDLPAMDDDDFRRGKPSCHKIYGEAIAVLAGDALQSFAFHLIAKQDAIRPDQIVKQVCYLANAIGMNGLCSGQAFDLTLEEYSSEDLQKIHQQKTACLFDVIVDMLLVLVDIPEERQVKFKEVFALFGLMFQLQDDFLDAKNGEIEKCNMMQIYSVVEMKNQMQKLNERVKFLLKDEQSEISLLQSFSNYLCERSH